MSITLRLHRTTFRAARRARISVPCSLPAPKAPAAHRAARTGSPRSAHADEGPTPPPAGNGAGRCGGRTRWWVPSALCLAAAAVLAVSGCHGDHGYDLRLHPTLTLLDSGPDFAEIAWGTPPEFAGAIIYELWRYEQGDGHERLLIALAPSETGYRDSTLEEGLEYEYRLYAYFEDAKKEDSAELKLKSDHTLDTSLKVARNSGSRLPWYPPAPSAPRLSPDGATLAFVEGGRVWLRDLASGAVDPLTEGALGPETGVAWLPDGARLVVAAGPPGAEDLWLVARPGGPATPLTRDGFGAAEPLVSPDGFLLAFLRAGGVWTLDLADPAALPSPLPR